MRNLASGLLTPPSIGSALKADLKRLARLRTLLAGSVGGVGVHGKF